MGGDNLAKYLADRGLTQDPAKVANKTDLVTKLTTALTDNKTYLGLTSPTTAQNTAQIKELTRQINKLIRLEVNDLSATD
jgi:hypothetical protein